MRAVTYTGARTLDVETREPIAPAPGQVQISVEYVGICGTDLHIYHGDMDARVKRPAVVGHEMSGRIAAIGEGVTGWAVGQPVTVMPLIWDNTCPACLAGNQHLCHKLIFIGIDAPGAMQGSWTVPADVLVALPPSMALDHAALVEPTAVAVHDVRRAELVAGEKALVVGGGPVGLLIAIVARREGADVTIVELDDYRRGVAEGLGFVTLDPRSVDVAEAVNTWTGGAGAAVVFEVSGAAGGMTTAVDNLAVRGRLVLVAIHSQPREVNLFKFFWRELSLIAARLYVRSDFERAVELVADGTVPADVLISKIEPLERTADAFAALEHGAGVMKVLVACQSDAE
jgi:(R,R)-butanediol dehydrogenase / meso-butanediol dehydrogenase / diacetyl reductase